MHTQPTTQTKSKPATQHTGEFFGNSATPFFQPKLTVNTPGDAYEQEADQVADQVMRMGEGDAPIVQRMALSSVGGVQRQCAACASKDQEEQLHRKETGGGDASGKAAPPIVSDVLSSGGGQPMDGGTRQHMESRFGQDFGQVRIHTDSRAAQSADAIQARAYTSGNNIVFRQGEYQPATSEGQRLLAHELVHVGQQGGGETSTLQRDNTPPNPAERDAIERVPTAVLKISASGMVFKVPPEATLLPGPRRPQIWQIILKNLLGDAFRINLADELEKHVLSRKGTRLAGHLHIKTEDARGGEPIGDIYVYPEALPSLQDFFVSRNLNPVLSEEQKKVLLTSLYQSVLWDMVKKIAPEEGIKIPKWYDKAIFDSEMESPDMIAHLTTFRQFLENRHEALAHQAEAKKVKDKTEAIEAGEIADAAQSNAKIIATALLYDLDRTFALMEAIRTDWALNENIETQILYQALWLVPEKKKKSNKPSLPVWLRSLQVFKEFIRFSKQNDSLATNAEIYSTQRVELLKLFILQNGLKQDDLIVLDPFPARIWAPDINEDFTTVTTAENTFRMAVNSDDPFASLLDNVATASNRRIFYRWSVHTLPISIQNKKAAGSSPEELRLASDEFVKNSPGNLSAPLKTYETDEDYEQQVGMKKPGEGSFLLVSHAEPRYRSEWKRIQKPSSAGHPYFVFDAADLAHQGAYGDWDVLESLKQQLATAPPEKKSEIEENIQRLTTRETTDLLALTQKDLEDTGKLLLAARKLKTFIEDDRQKQIPFQGDKTHDPFTIRLQRFDPVLYDIGLMVRSNYGATRFDDLTALGHFIEALETQTNDLTHLRKRALDASSRFKEGSPQYRVVAALVKKDDGNLIPLLFVAGYHEDTDLSDPNKKKYRIKLVDVTFDSKKQDMIYVGGTYATEGEAINSAFVKFGEDNKYGNGSIVYRLPGTPHTGRVASVTTFWEYLEMAVMALGLVLLVAGVVMSAGTLGPAAMGVIMALGISLAVAGAALSIRNIKSRIDKGTLEMDTEMALDIINIIAAAVAVIGTVGRISAMAARVSTMTRAMMVQRLDRLLFIYDVTDFGANAYLLHQKVGEDTAAIKKLGLPPAEEQKLLEQVAMDAIQQGAMLGVAVHGIGRQVSEHYRARVNDSPYQSLAERKIIELHPDGSIKKVSPDAPPYIREAVEHKTRLPETHQQGESARKQATVEAVETHPTHDGQHLLTGTDRGRIIRCSDFCADLRWKYKDIIDLDLDLHQRLEAIEARVVEAGKTRDKASMQKALADAAELESTLKWAQDEWNNFLQASDSEIDSTLDFDQFTRSELTGGPKSGRKIDGVRIPKRKRRRIDLSDLMTQAEITTKGGYKKAIERVGKVMGKKIADIDILKKHWDAAKAEVLDGKAIESYGQEKVNKELYPQAQKKFWQKVRRDPEAVKLVRDAGFDFEGNAPAPLAQLGPQGKDPKYGIMTDQERRISLDHIDEKAQGDNWKKALDAENLELMFQNANTQKETTQVKFGRKTAP